jgi:hypothetical protein
MQMVAIAQDRVQRFPRISTEQLEHFFDRVRLLFRTWCHCLHGSSSAGFFRAST